MTRTLSVIGLSPPVAFATADTVTNPSWELVAPARLGTEVTVSRSRRSSICHPSRVTLSMVLGGIATGSACAGATTLATPRANVAMLSEQARTKVTHIAGTISG